MGDVAIWSFSCPRSTRGLKGNPFLRRIPGTESSRLAHFAVKLARFDSAGRIPPRLLGNGGGLCSIASSPVIARRPRRGRRGNPVLRSPKSRPHGGRWPSGARSEGVVLLPVIARRPRKGATWQSGPSPAPVRGVASPSQWGGGAKRRWGAPGDSPARLAAFNGTFFAADSRHRIFTACPLRGQARSIR